MDDKIYVDIESTGLDPRLDKLRILSIDGDVYDMWDKYDAEEGKERLFAGQHKTFVAHNAQFDLDFLAEHLGYHHKGSVFDTMVAYQLIRAGRRQPNGKPVSAYLDNVASVMLGIKVDKTFQKADWSKEWIDDVMREYASEDTRILKPLAEALEYEIRKADLGRIAKLEMQLLPVLLYAKRKGVRLDVSAAHRLVAKLHMEAGELERRLPYIPQLVDKPYAEEGALFEFAANMPKERLNPRAPAQVAEYFGLPDATEDTLREYIKRTNDPHAKVVQDIKKKTKKASTIEKQLLQRVRYDGRIHPSYLQTFTETGRLSSREPNLQNQDRGKDVRSLFIPADDHRMVIADYSQLELRLAAFFSRDRNMLQAYREGRDLHTETQARIFGEPRSDEENKRTRTLSKNINFGLVFGGGHNTLIKFAAKSGVEIGEQEAREYRDAFRAAYPDLAKWQQREGDVRKEYVRTFRGRRRYITPGEGYCTRINNIVQGSAADGVKIAMVYLYRKHNIVPILSVHDEVVVECPEVNAESVLAIIQNVLVDAMYRATGQDPKNPVVPIGVEAQVAESWAEK